MLLPRHCTSNIDVVEDRMPGNNPLRQIPSSSAPSEVRYPGLPTYEEAITPETERPVRTEFAPSAQNVLRCTDYSSDPDEAHIHFEICLQLDPQEVDTEILIVGEKGGDIHHRCMTIFIVMKSK